MTVVAQTNASAGSGMSAPRIAVIISCYNYDRYVAKAIQSVLDQRCADCELVVVDDGSSDNSWAVIEQSGVKAFRIENRGAPGAFLFGAEQTSAPFVLFLDADDELRPGALQTILPALDSRVSKLQFPLVWVDENNTELMISPKLKGGRDGYRTAQQVLKTSVYISPPTSGNIFRRDVALLLSEINSGLNDVDGTILFVAPFMGDIVSIAEPLGLYRIHSQNDSGIGREVKPSILERNMSRHIFRMTNLRILLQRLGVSDELVDPKKTYYYRDLEFMLCITTGRHIGAGRVAALMKCLWMDYLPIDRKAALSLFYLAAATSPSPKARRLLNYRMSPAGRSYGGFLKLVFS